MEQIDINLTGVNPSEVHIHLNVQDPQSQEILDRLTSMEQIMSDVQAALDAQTDAINANTAAMNDAIARVNEDVAHLEDLLAQANGLLDQALANDASDAAAIADLTQQNAALQADAAATIERINASTQVISDSTSTLQNVDPLTDNPTPPAPGV